MPPPDRDVPRPGTDAKTKRAAKVADRIVEDVVALGWPVGEVLGSERDMLERYQVSRAVFREAVCLLEHEQVARTRRGPGGGLVITEPTIDAVVDAVVVYLHRVDARLDEIFEARIVLEELAAQLAAERANELARHELRRVIRNATTEPDRAPPEFHALIAAGSDNATLGLFIAVFDRVTQLYPPERRRHGSSAEDALHAHVMIAEAVLAGNGGLARHRMRSHLEAEADSFGRRSTRQLLPDAVVLADSGRGKGAEAVARHINQTVVTERLRPGDLVGTEPELVAREGVSRALLREAVRLLEHHRVARMRRGPGGGLFVLAPSEDAVTDIVAIYLGRRNVGPDELAEVRTGVEVAIADLAAGRIDEAGIADLHDALHREENATDAERVEAAYDLHAAVAAAAQNSVLDLVALTLLRLSRQQPGARPAPTRRREIEAEVSRSHAGIAQAVASGDRELARQRMRRHLEAVGSLAR